MQEMEIYGGKLTFNDGSHRYFFNGEAVPGVTTILSRLSKPALIQWAADMAVQHIERNALSTEEGYLVSDDCLIGAKTAHRVVRDTAADIGTAVHDYASKVLIGDAWEPATTDMETQARGAFDRWLAEHKVEPVELERMVFSKYNWFAGRTDFYGVIDGRKATLDFKTSSAIYVEHWLQATAYDIALCEELGGEPTDRWVVRLDKNTGAFDAQKRAPNIDHNAAFLSAVGLHRAMGAIEKAERELAPRKPRKAKAADDRTEAAVSG
jgi:hypothetical protein